MRFNIALGMPSPNMNANSRRTAGIGGTAEKYGETSYKQTPEEHRALLNKFMAIPGLPKDIARQMGEAEEKASPRYWDTDTTPRYGGSTPSSSFVQAMDVSPALGLCTFTMKNGRSYSYPLTADQAGDIINANSIGAAYNKFCKLGRSNIPVSITPRSGNLSGPPQMKIPAGTTANPAVIATRALQASPNIASTLGGGAAMLGLKGIGEIIKLLKK